VAGEIGLWDGRATTGVLVPLIMGALIPSDSAVQPKQMAAILKYAQSQPWIAYSIFQMAYGKTLELMVRDVLMIDPVTSGYFEHLGGKTGPTGSGRAGFCTTSVRQTKLNATSAASTARRCGALPTPRPERGELATSARSSAPSVQAPCWLAYKGGEPCPKAS
jgi:hypothetical protein